MEKNKKKVIAFAGSLRKDSYNQALLLHMQKNLPEDLEMEILSIKDIPLFSEDLEEGPLPQAVIFLREKLEEADGLIITTPEYNSSIPGVLKNTIDWLSRKGQDGFPFSRKPVMIGGATTGILGTAKAQKELRSVLNSINACPMNTPELFVAEAGSKFANGILLDEKAISHTKRMLERFSEWIESLS